MKILVIGGGNMGLMYAESPAKSNFLRSGELMIVDRNADKLRKENEHA